MTLISNPVTHVITQAATVRQPRRERARETDPLIDFLERCLSLGQPVAKVKAELRDEPGKVAEKKLNRVHV